MERHRNRTNRGVPASIGAFSALAVIVACCTAGTLPATGGAVPVWLIVGGAVLVVGGIAFAGIAALRRRRRVDGD